tara:strand:- start:11212 stop:11505 length:294 start_codon:yes stop_codon:yes gene_type:complete
MYYYEMDFGGGSAERDWFEERYEEPTNKEKSIKDITLVINAISDNKKNESINIFTPNELSIIREITRKSLKRINNGIIGKDNIIQHEREQTIKNVLD